MPNLPRGYLPKLLHDILSLEASAREGTLCRGGEKTSAEVVVCGGGRRVAGAVVEGWARNGEGRDGRPDTALPAAGVWVRLRLAKDAPRGQGPPAAKPYIVHPQTSQCAWRAYKAHPSHPPASNRCRTHSLAATRSRTLEGVRSFALVVPLTFDISNDAAYPLLRKAFDTTIYSNHTYTYTTYTRNLPLSYCLLSPPTNCIHTHAHTHPGHRYCRILGFTWLGRRHHTRFIPLSSFFR